MREYDGKPMRDDLLDRLPAPSYPNFLVYVMGPYTKTAEVGLMLS